jgi:hypothetical protein
VGYPNILKVGEPVFNQPEPSVTAASDNIGYLGHIVWVGPQSQWWSQQDVNPERKAAKASWPADPFTVQAKNTAQLQMGNRLEFTGVKSPVTGLQLNKSFYFDAKNKNKLHLSATATNIRESNVSWDLWFNTRLAADAKIYMLVANASAVRAQNNQQNPAIAPLEFDISSHALLTLPNRPLAQGQQQREGKLLIQPRQGWMAAFAKGQLLVMQFEHLPAAVIHPEQGQIEIYVNYPANAEAEGLLEMEIHGAYQTLAPGSKMTLTASWLLLPYDGDDTDQARIAFLQQVL